MLLIEGVYNSKNILLLEIGRSDDILYAVDTAKLHEDDRTLIKTNKDALDGLTSKDRYAWLKQNCPSLRGAYKTYKIEKLRITNNYNL